MALAIPCRPRVFVDAGLLLAGSAAPSEHAPSLLVLRMAELALIEACASRQVILDVERNLERCCAGALPAFRLLASRCLRQTADPSREELRACRGLAEPEDLPALAAALKSGCPWLATIEPDRYPSRYPHLTVLNPIELFLRVRDLLARLGEP